jgi:hypothetical protein
MRGTKDLDYTIRSSYRLALNAGILNEIANVQATGSFLRRLLLESATTQFDACPELQSALLRLEVHAR